jgi:hypothetical protein
MLGRMFGSIGGGGILESNTGLRKTGTGGPSVGGTLLGAGSGWESSVVDSSRLISSSVSIWRVVLGSEDSSIRSKDRRLASFSRLVDGRYLLSCWPITWEIFAFVTCFFLVDKFLLAAMASSVEDAGKDLGQRG